MAKCFTVLVVSLLLLENGSPALASNLTTAIDSTTQGNWTNVPVTWHCSHDYARTCTATDSITNNPAAHYNQCGQYGADPRSAIAAGAPQYGAGTAYNGRGYCVNAYYLFGGNHWDLKAWSGISQANDVVTSCNTEATAAGILIGSYTASMLWNPNLAGVGSGGFISHQSKHQYGQSSDDIYVYREASSDFKSQFFQPNNSPDGGYTDNQYTWRPDGNYTCDAGDFGPIIHPYYQSAMGFPNGTSTKGVVFFMRQVDAFLEMWDLDANTYTHANYPTGCYPFITPNLVWWPDYQGGKLMLLCRSTEGGNPPNYLQPRVFDWGTKTWSQWESIPNNVLRSAQYEHFILYDAYHGWVWAGGGNDQVPSYMNILKPDGTYVPELAMPTALGHVGSGQGDSFAVIDPASGKLVVFTDDRELWEYDPGTTGTNGAGWVELCDCTAPGCQLDTGTPSCAPPYTWPSFLNVRAQTNGADYLVGMLLDAVPEHGVIAAMDYTGPTSNNAMWVYRHTAGTPAPPPSSPAALRIP